MISKEQAREIYNHYSQIEAAETLIGELKNAMAKIPIRSDDDIIRDNNYHPHGSIVIEVPYFEAGRFTESKGSRVYNISYPSAIRVLKNHVKQLKRELKQLQEDTK